MNLGEKLGKIVAAIAIVVFFKSIQYFLVLIFAILNLIVNIIKLTIKKIVALIKKPKEVII